MPNYFRIELKNAIFYTEFGFYDIEKKVTQPIEITLELTLEATEFIESRSMEDTIDYEKMLEICRIEVHKSFDLLEDLAINICSHCKSTWKGLVKTEIAITKRPIMKNSMASTTIYYSA